MAGGVTGVGVREQAGRSLPELLLREREESRDTSAASSYLGSLQIAIRRAPRRVLCHHWLLLAALGAEECDSAPGCGAVLSDAPRQRSRPVAKLVCSRPTAGEWPPSSPRPQPFVAAAEWQPAPFNNKTSHEALNRARRLRRAADNLFSHRLLFPDAHDDSDQ
ncbi:hypothetical protein BU26DRAFT_511937 [Trematosphaeria pertusa]|uniref:Uncharacterized protein n=1 Tax=Trematosphaeria pertusa TaxID=390896 RepID=A0A6A6HSN8_9PLEO|nr:uncharacterized protein BU26DRAFT_511937 [Trematosphaeria pertusa]KAF2240788.1 hypothetical protein BU26DRAFT_511937 [Trematosphaeria pertusa]